MAHPHKDERAVTIHAIGPPLEGSRQNRSEPSRLFAIDIPGRDSVIRAACRVRTINTRTPFDHVEVELQNALLAEDQFGDRYQSELRALAEYGAARSEKEIFYQLLRDGGSAAHAAAFHILVGGNLDLMPVKPMVLVKARVLSGDDGVLKIGPDLVERDEVVPFAIGFVVPPGLQPAFDMHSSGWRVDPAGGQKQEREEQP